MENRIDLHQFGCKVAPSPLKGVIVLLPDFSSGDRRALALTDGDWPIRRVVEAGALL
jgi:hypothetical protein